MHGLDDPSAIGLYDLSVNGLDVLSINVHPQDVRVLHGFSVTGLKRLSVNIHTFDVRYSLDVTPESSLHGLNGLGTELVFSGLNVLNDLGPELAQEQPRLICTKPIKNSTNKIGRVMMH